MERVIGIETEIGIITGREIYLNKADFIGERSLTIHGEFSVNQEDKKFVMKFEGIIFLSSIELDFDKREQVESLGFVENSYRLLDFKRLDHSSKVSPNCKHYYVRTYDTVFEIVASRFELRIEA